MLVLSLLATVAVAPKPAQAATPLFGIAVGQYGGEAYDFHRLESATLSVTDNGVYRHSLLVGDTRIEVDLVQATVGTNRLNPFFIEVKNMYLGGLVFYPVYAASEQPIYRPYLAGGILQPGLTWEFDAVSTQAGGVGLHQASTVALAPIRMKGEVAPVQRIDTVATLSGNASGTFKITHLEVLGNPAKFRDIYFGDYTVAGQRYVVNASVSVGGL